MAYTHTDGTSDEDWLPSKLIDIQHGRDGGKEKQDSTNAACKQGSGVTSQAQVRENELLRSLSQNEVKPLFSIRQIAGGTTDGCIV
jgi:hypothetical protein